MIGLIVDCVGWLGALGLLSAYAFVSSGRVNGHVLYFQVLNLFGAAGLLVNGIHHGAWPSAALNAVWLVIGFSALAQLRPTPASSLTRADCGTPLGQRTDSTSTDG